MKKIIIAILTLSITLGILSGCGSKNKSEDATPPKGTTTDSTGNKEKPVVVTPGTELTDFMSKYTDTKTKVWDEMSKKFDEEGNPSFAMGALGFAFADLAIVDILFFDTLTEKDGDTFKGKLMFTGIDAWKKVKGDIVEFGYDYTNLEDKNQSQSGDKSVAKGKFDKSNKSLIYERSTERSGKVMDKYVVEITRNSDTSYSSQIYFLDSSSNDGAGKNHLTGYLTWFDDKDIISYLIEKDTTDVNFTYNSIYGKKNIKPEEMAKGSTVTMKTSYIDGKSLFEQLDSK
jgi:hypothetical protein